MDKVKGLRQQRKEMMREFSNAILALFKQVALKDQVTFLQFFLGDIFTYALMRASGGQWTIIDDDGVMTFIVPHIDVMANNGFTLPKIRAILMDNIANEEVGDV